MARPGLCPASHRLAASPAGEQYVFWSFLTRRERFPDDVEEAGPERLRTIADEMTPAWHPRLKHLIHGADPASVMLLRYASSRPPQPWAAMPVTLLGDAVHNMPPTGGEGANMALKDAHTYAVRGSDGLPGGDLRDALSVYEDRMRSYAFKAVETSMTNLERMIA